MTWECPAIDHGVTIYPNGQISPCCWTKGNYLKPIKDLTNPNRFADLKTENPPDACERCVVSEFNARPSYRHTFQRLKTSAPGLQFVDIRNTNLCNLKCRFCGPHFSSQWAHELSMEPTIQHQSLEPWKSILFTEDLHWLYFTGGEPMISADHWNILQQLVDTQDCKNISLIYNSNLTVNKFKDVGIESLWKNFKNVHLRCSIEAVGKPLEYIRSGANWQQIDSNIRFFKSFDNVTIRLCPVIGILNFWFLPDLVEYAKQNALMFEPVMLLGPDYLALDVIPDEIQSQALQILDSIKNSFPPTFVQHMKTSIENNVNSVLFGHTVNHILYLDALRQEKLFDLLPFRDIVVERFIKNYEYDQR